MTIDSLQGFVDKWIRVNRSLNHSNPDKVFKDNKQMNFKKHQKVRLSNEEYYDPSIAPSIASKINSSIKDSKKKQANLFVGTSRFAPLSKKSKAYLNTFPSSCDTLKTACLSIPSSCPEEMKNWDPFSSGKQESEFWSQQNKHNEPVIRSHNAILPSCRNVRKSNYSTYQASQSNSKTSTTKISTTCQRVEKSQTQHRKQHVLTLDKHPCASDGMNAKTLPSYQKKDDNLKSSNICKNCCYIENSVNASLLEIQNLRSTLSTYEQDAHERENEIQLQKVQQTLNGISTKLEVVTERHTQQIAQMMRENKWQRKNMETQLSSLALKCKHLNEQAATLEVSTSETREYIDCINTERDTLTRKINCLRGSLMNQDNIRIENEKLRQTIIQRDALYHDLGVKIEQRDQVINELLLRLEYTLNEITSERKINRRRRTITHV